MTTNFDDSDLLNRYGPRIYDRVTEMFDKISFENKTYRK